MAHLSHVTRERVLEALRLSRLLPQTRLVTSGGNVSGGFVSEARAMARALVAAGVPPGRVSCEEASLDTCENARQCARIVGGERFILVTSAVHLPRAMAEFEALGLKPIPAPAGYLTTLGGYTFQKLFPSEERFRASGAAIHEWLGLAWFKARITFGGSPAPRAETRMHSISPLTGTLCA
jgi:uncharacterized SAM-binding protein YcdF (DUF218 family)